MEPNWTNEGKWKWRPKKKVGEVKRKNLIFVQSPRLHRLFLHGNVSATLSGRRQSRIFHRRFRPSPSAIVFWRKSLRGSPYSVLVFHAPSHSLRIIFFSPRRSPRLVDEHNLWLLRRLGLEMTSRQATIFCVLVNLQRHQSSSENLSMSRKNIFDTQSYVNAEREEKTA